MQRAFFFIHGHLWSSVLFKGEHMQYVHQVYVSHLPIVRVVLATKKQPMNWRYTSSHRGCAESNQTQGRPYE